MRAPTGERQGHPSTHEDRVSGPVSKCARTEGGLLEGAPCTASVPRGASRVALATSGGLLRAVAGWTTWQHERGEGGGAAGVVRADGALGGREVRLSRRAWQRRCPLRSCCDGSSQPRRTCIRPGCHSRDVLSKETRVLP